MNMVFDKIGNRGSWEIAQSAQPAHTILAVYLEPKRFFFFSSRKFSSAAPTGGKGKGDDTNDNGGLRHWF